MVLLRRVIQLAPLSGNEWALHRCAHILRVYTTAYRAVTVDPQAAALFVGALTAVLPLGTNPVCPREDAGGRVHACCTTIGRGVTAHLFGLQHPPRLLAATPLVGGREKDERRGKTASSEKWSAPANCRAVLSRALSHAQVATFTNATRLLALCAQLAPVPPPDLLLDLGRFFLTHMPSYSRTPLPRPPWAGGSPAAAQRDGHHRKGPAHKSRAREDAGAAAVVADFMKDLPERWFPLLASLMITVGSAQSARGEDERGEGGGWSAGGGWE